MRDGDVAESLAAGGLEWLLAVARPVAGGGLEWPVVPGAGGADVTLYNGAAGVVLAFLEGERHFGDVRFGEAALRGARRLSSMVDECGQDSLYTGLAGVALVLRAVRDRLGDTVSGVGADRALERVRGRFDGTGWSRWRDLLLGNGGIALAAVELGCLDLAVSAVEPYLRLAERTAHGVVWRARADMKQVLHHLSHGTLGFAYALGVVGDAAGRPDFIELALSGVADVLARDVAGPDGFLVPHSDPFRHPEWVDEFNYGWCHGPAGDAHLFRLLAGVAGGVDRCWEELADRCWASIVGSGLPVRSRPGFWDNNGRCCGTAGVLALACDRIVEGRGGREFAGGLVRDLADRAIVDGVGVRWSNHEHRDGRGDLEPRTGWGHGNAGIVRELLRFARVSSGGGGDYVLRLPDQPVAVSGGPRV